MTTIMSVDEFNTMYSSTTHKGSPEHDMQVELFNWATLMALKHPELELLMAIPNGASYGGGGGRWNIAKRMKAEGVKKGVPDIFLPIPMTRLDGMGGVVSMEAGLWIEMKAGKNKTSPEQNFWIEKLTEYGYKVCVCYSAEDAMDCIMDYLTLKK